MNPPGLAGQPQGSCRSSTARLPKTVQRLQAREDSERPALAERHILVGVRTGCSRGLRRVAAARSLGKRRTASERADVRGGRAARKNRGRGWHSREQSRRPRLDRTRLNTPGEEVLRGPLALLAVSDCQGEEARLDHHHDSGHEHQLMAAQAASRSHLEERLPGPILADFEARDQAIVQP